MGTVENRPLRAIPILTYQDPLEVQRFLVETFGFRPDPDAESEEGSRHTAVLTEGGPIWLHPESTTFGLSSPARTGECTVSMAVLVEDVDEHHRRTSARGAEVLYPPVNQSYGYREYSARDVEGALWSFMQVIAP